MLRVIRYYLCTYMLYIYIEIESNRYVRLKMTNEFKFKQFGPYLTSVRYIHTYRNMYRVRFTTIPLNLNKFVRQLAR